MVAINSKKPTHITASHVQQQYEYLVREAEAYRRMRIVHARLARSHFILSAINAGVAIYVIFWIFTR